MNKFLLLFYVAFLINYCYSSNVFSIGGKCVSSPIIKDFDPKKVKKQ